MIRYVSWLFLLSTVPLFAEFRGDRTLVAARGFPEAVVADRVNVITGDYVEHCLDLYIPGPEPLEIWRNHCSGDRYNRLVCYQWSTNHPEEIFVDERQHEIFGGEPYGIAFDYLVVGVDRQSAGEQGYYKPLAVESDPSDRWLAFAAPEQCVVTSGSGETRVYHPATFDPRHNLTRLRITEVRKPSGNRVQYAYDEQGRLAEIRTLSRSGTEVLNWAQFNYPRNHSMNVVGSNGEEVTYVYRTPPKPGVFARKNLKCVVRTQGPSQGYQMVQWSDRFPERICRVETEGEPTLEIEYYGSDLRAFFDHPLHGRVKALYMKDGDSPRLLTHRFRYHFEPDGSGYTDVLCADASRQRYYYDTHLHLVKVEEYRGDLVAVRQFVWGEGIHAAHLLRRSEETPCGTELWAVEYLYDNHGNEIQRKRVDLGTAVIEHSSTYTADGSNLCLSTVDSAGNRWEYTYIEGLNRVKTARLTAPNGTLIEAREYDYDDAGFCLNERLPTS